MRGGRKAKKQAERDERELLSELKSERMAERRRLRRKHITSAVLASLMVAILGLLAYMGARGVVIEAQKNPTDPGAEYQLQAEVVDETGSEQISRRTLDYIGLLEQDLAELGIKMTRATLPVNTSRELYVDTDASTTYFKVSLDRGTGVTAEDVSRMLKYLQDRGLTPGYVDVRVEGKAYYQ